MIRHILAGTLLASFALGAQAQTQPQDTTLNRTVVVEQEYNPDIMDASKVNVLPKVEPLTVNKKAVEYNATLMPATHIPAGTMQAYPGTEKQAKARPGYVRLGYGNYGNLDVRANYLFTLSPKDRLNLTFAMDGMDGKLDLPEEEGKWNSFFYRTHAAMDYTHAFKQVDLNIAGRFDQSNFNLQPGFARGKQKFLSGDVHLGINSTYEDKPLQFRAETNLLLYERQNDLYISNLKENIIRTKADVFGAISEAKTVGVAFALDNVFYNGTPDNGQELDNQTNLDMNPYYRYQTDSWNIRLGAHVSLTAGSGTKWFAAPDISAQYTFSDSYLLYAQATGGRLQNDFRRLASVNPYAMLQYGTAAPTYEQLNAAIGFKASPLCGLWMHIYGGYQRVIDDFYAVPQTESFESPLINGYYWAQADANNLYAGGEIDYSYKDLLAFHGAATIYSWDGKQEEDLLFMKPAFQTDVRIDFRPIPSVRASVGYQFISREDKSPVKAASVSNLYLGGSYELFPGISVYVRANNLLNKAYQYYRGCPAEGLNFVGGVSFRF